MWWFTTKKELKIEIDNLLEKHKWTRKEINKRAKWKQLGELRNEIDKMKKRLSEIEKVRESNENMVSREKIENISENQEISDNPMVMMTPSQRRKVLVRKIKEELIKGSNEKMLIEKMVHQNRETSITSFYRYMKEAKKQINMEKVKEQ